MLHKINNSVVAGYAMWDFVNHVIKTGQVAGLSLKIIDQDHTTVLATYTLAAGDIVESGATGIYYVDGDIPSSLFDAAGTYFALWVCSVVGCENAVLELIEINNADINTFAAGIGSNQLTLTVNDSLGLPIADVNVAIWNNAQTILITWGQTNSSGQLIRAINDGTYKVRLRKALYDFSIETVVVNGDTTATVTATGSFPLPPIGPDMCVVFEYFFMPDGITPMSEQPNDSVRIVSLPADYGGQLHTGEIVRGNYVVATGGLYWNLIRNAKVEFVIPDFGIRKSVTIPDTATKRLSDIT